MGAKTRIYLVLSILVSLAFFIDAYVNPSANATLWLCWLAVLLMLWCSWPAWRSLRLRQATVVLSGLVVLNATVSPMITLLSGLPSPTLEPNLREEIRFVEGAAPGIEGVQRVTTNERGHRTNGAINYDHKPEGVLRIAAIGGSTTEESKLDDHKTWTYQLAVRLSAETGRKVEIINSALSGVRAEQNYYALRESESYSPDIALFIMGGNDWDYAIDLANSTAFHRFMLQVKPFGFGNTVLFRAAKTIERTGEEILRRRLKPSEYVLIVDDVSFNASSRDSLSRSIVRPFRPESVDADYAYWVRKIFAECRRRHLLCLFADQPSAYQPGVSSVLRKRFWMTPPFASYTVPLDDMVRLARLYNGWLANAARENDMPFCALAANIPPTPNDLLDDCHLTEKGSSRIAELMERCLVATHSATLIAHKRQ